LIGAGACAAAPGDGGAAVAGPGDPGLGRAVFTGKQCGHCHLPRGEPGAGPALEELRRPQGALELAGRLWNHVPGMFAALAQGRLEWPRISVAEMSNLMAYLRADAARDPAADHFEGQVTLVRKGCLKCHSLRGEGGRIEPDLSAHRADYASAPAWAATMWAHTPRMAAMAHRQGIAYPRFSGHEMGDLLGFLRSAAVAMPPSGSKPAPKR
jgi:cytochrome c551/c552